MAMSREEIYENVQDILVEALGVDEDEISEEAKISADLGAESIDYLDIQFNLEKKFSIKVPREELFPAESLLTDSQFVDDGKLTEAGLAKLTEGMPHVDFTEFAQDPDINKITDLFTVESIVKYVEKKLA